jgi:hypothetical protein
MKKFNLFKEIIKVTKTKLLDAINSKEVFGIDIYGNIITKFSDKDILIYKAKADAVQDITKSLGKNYQVVEDNDTILIKAFSNWQELININIPNSSYDDTTADGVGEFSNKELETIGWHATEFNIRYRELVELLEDKCEGILLCIEQEEPYQFSGLGFLSDNKHAKEIMFNYCRDIAKDKLQNDDDFHPDTLTEDEQEAYDFFNQNPNG